MIPDYEEVREYEDDGVDKEDLADAIAVVGSIALAAAVIVVYVVWRVL